MKESTKVILAELNKKPDKKIQKMFYLPERLVNELKAITGDGNMSAVVERLIQDFIDDVKRERR